jgi:hypothetical protein
VEAALLEMEAVRAEAAAERAILVEEGEYLADYCQSLSIIVEKIENGSVRVEKWKRK